MSSQNKSKITSEKFRSKLKLKHIETKSRVREKYPHVHEFFKNKGLDLGKIREHSAKLLGTGVLTSTLLLGFPNDLKLLPAPHEILAKFGEESGSEEISKKVLVDTFNSLLPKRPRPLTRVEEKLLEQVFFNVIGIPVRASLEGEHLNTTYGYIGAEQHLRRYPGDSLKEHGEGKILEAGMAPGLSAWGYFARSKEDMTQQLIDIEKWYAVVQTLYLPDWNKRQPYLKNWYKYRKVMIVNCENGNAVVAAIADSGPAAWTGKQFGGSPEVMNVLGGPRYKKGPVIIFFVDDPENEIPLGPVQYKSKEIGMLREKL